MSKHACMCAFQYVWASTGGQQGDDRSGKEINVLLSLSKLDWIMDSGFYLSGFKECLPGWPAEPNNAQWTHAIPSRHRFCGCAHPSYYCLQLPVLSFCCMFIWAQSCCDGLTAANSLTELIRLTHHVDDQAHAHLPLPRGSPGRETMVGGGGLIFLFVLSLPVLLLIVMTGLHFVWGAIERVFWLRI